MSSRAVSVLHVDIVNGVQMVVECLHSSPIDASYENLQSCRSSVPDESGSRDSISIASISLRFVPRSGVSHTFELTWILGLDCCGHDSYWSQHLLLLR